MPEIPLYSVTRLDAVPATLQNFKGNPTNTGIFWNVHEWVVGEGRPSAVTASARASGEVGFSRSVRLRRTVLVRFKADTTLTAIC